MYFDHRVIDPCQNTASPPRKKKLHSSQLHRSRLAPEVAPEFLDSMGMSPGWIFCGRKKVWERGIFLDLLIKVVVLVLDLLILKGGWEKKQENFPQMSQ